MNYQLRLSKQLAQEADFLQMFRNSLGEFGEGVALDFIEQYREGGNTVLRHCVRRVELIHLEEGFWLRFSRGTKGSTETQFDLDDAEDQVDAVCHTINWLLLNEFSCTNPVELKAMKDKEAAKYD